MGKQCQSCLFYERTNNSLCTPQYAELYEDEEEVDSFPFVLDEDYSGPMQQSLPVDRRGIVYTPRGFKRVKRSPSPST